jgi:hypothetical protein
VHITIGVLTLTWAAALKEATSAIASQPALNEPLPLRFATTEGDFTAEVGRRLEWLGSTLSSLDAEAVARRLRRSVLTTRQSLLRGQMHRLLSLSDLTDASVVARRHGSMCAMEEVDGELSVMLGDRELRMPSTAEPALRRLATGGKTSVSDLPGLDMPGRLVLVQRLIREGFLEVVS